MVVLVLNGTTRTKLATLASLYWGEIVKNSFAFGNCPLIDSNITLHVKLLGHVEMTLHSVSSSLEYKKSSFYAETVIKTIAECNDKMVTHLVFKQTDS